MATPPFVHEQSSDKRRFFPASVQASTVNMSIGAAANAAATVALTGSSTAAGVGDGAHNNPVKVAGVWWSYSGIPTGGRLTLASGGNNFIDIDITSGGPGFVDFDPPYVFPTDAGVTLTLAAGGTGVTGKVGLRSWQAL